MLKQMELAQVISFDKKQIGEKLLHMKAVSKLCSNWKFFVRKQMELAHLS